VTETLELMEVAPTAETRAAAVVERANAAVTHSRDDILMAAMNRGFTPEQIEKMMDLRDRQDRYVAEKAYREDFAAFRGENIIVPKTKEVDRGRGGSFVQAEYHVAAALLSPALSRHGFSFRHDQRFGSKPWKTDGVESDVAWVWVTCFLEHRAGHSEKLELEGPPGDLSVNTPTQNMQVTASYLKRQSLLAITGTATGGEDDESRLRNRPSGTSEEDPALQAGRDAAMEGVAALTAWWGDLSAKQRGAWSKEFGRLRKDAAAVDAGVSHA
jgi:hypothetical protein